MIKNKLIYLFFFTFFILAILIDYSIYENRVFDKKNDHKKLEEIVNKSSITIQFESLVFGEISFFDSKNKSLFTILGHEISKKLSYLIYNSDLKKFYKNNKFDSKNTNILEDKYIVFYEAPITDEALYGKLYFTIDVFTTIKDEAFTNYILEKLKLIIQEDKDNFFNIIDTFVELFINEKDYYKKFNKTIENFDYNNSFNNNINVFIKTNRAYVPNPYTRYYVFTNFIPVFTTLTILMFFIYFIFLILIRNFKK